MYPLVTAMPPAAAAAPAARKQQEAFRRPSLKMYRNPPQLRFAGLPAELSNPAKVRSAIGSLPELPLSAFPARRRFLSNAEREIPSPPADTSSDAVLRTPR